MIDAQLELSFASAPGQMPVKRPGRSGRGPWWFDRMRRIVDRAFDWRPAPPPRPEQIWFGDTHRRLQAARVDPS